MTIHSHKIFELYTDGRRLYTESLVPGKTPFDEKKYNDGPREFREWDPGRSKVAAAITKGATNIGLRKSDVVLYLGVSHGYTASFISDMIGTEGIIFGVDPAPRVIRDLLFLSNDRPNIVPLLCDANHPEEYTNRICEPDIIIQDVAQRNQAEIFLKNCKLLKKGGYGLLAVKARSIDAKKSSKQIFEEVRKQIEEKLTVIDFRSLEPFERDHCMIIIKNEPPKDVMQLKETNYSKNAKSRPARTEYTKVESVNIKEYTPPEEVPKKDRSYIPKKQFLQMHQEKNNQQPPPPKTAKEQYNPPRSQAPFPSSPRNEEPRKGPQKETDPRGGFSEYMKKHEKPFARKNEQKRSKFKPRK